MTLGKLQIQTWRLTTQTVHIEWLTVLRSGNEELMLQAGTLHNIMTQFWELIQPIEKQVFSTEQWEDRQTPTYASHRWIYEMSLYVL